MLYYGTIYSVVIDFDLGFWQETSVLDKVLQQC